MEGKIHIRRCHVCGSVNEGHEHPVQKCTHCSKHLAPFYYFDESKVEPLSADLSVSEQLPAEGYGPLRGFTVFW